MRIDLHNLCTLCGEARLRFNWEFEQAKKNLDAGKRLGAGAMGINLGLWIMAISIMMGM